MWQQPAPHHSRNQSWADNPIVNVVFDTNLLFKPNVLRELAQEPGFTLWASMANVIETVSDIEDELSFRRARRQLQLMLEVSPHHFLPDADTQYLMASRREYDEANVLKWKRLAEVVAEATDYEQLCTTGVDLVRLRGMRAEHGNAFITVTEQMIRSIRPNARIDEKVFDIRLSPDELASVRDLLFGPDGLPAVARAWLRRARENPRSLKTEDFAMTCNFVGGYYFVFRGWLLHLLTNNVRPQPNDAFDLELAVPLGLKDWMLVSGDGALQRWIEKGEMPQRLWRHVV